MNTYEAPVPYDIPDLDGITRGRLLSAANHGDNRAKATLKAHDAERRAELAAQEADRHSDNLARGNTVAAGRELFRKTHERDRYDA